MFQLFRTEIEKEQIRQDCATRLQEKEQEFNEVRKNFQKALDQLQTALENEARAKVDALHKKKVLEADFNKMEIELENANKSITEAQATIRRYQNMVCRVLKTIIQLLFITFSLPYLSLLLLLSSKSMTSDRVLTYSTLALYSFVIIYNIETCFEPCTPFSWCLFH